MKLKRLQCKDTEKWKYDRAIRRLGRLSKKVFKCLFGVTESYNLKHRAKEILLDTEGLMTKSFHS